MSKSTLGEVIRFMAKKALQSESKECRVPVRSIFKEVRGEDYPEVDVNEKDGLKKTIKSRSMTELKNSYIYNTVSRMTELREANVRARYKFIWLDEDKEETTPAAYDGDGADKYLVIYIENGSVEPRAKQKEKAKQEQAAIDRFKARLLKLSPNVLEFEGDELTGAVKAIRMYQEMIKEFN
ncbi:hypothetical protein [Escherichia phage e4/1c]|uniref:Uncharacterized protein n=1 Tax=Escherichia phage e4/1c TaxID=1495286 RepID=A0A023ZUY1_9CAUD|nr:hypothetical protein e41c_0063 [Escherichia phage e4/1c]AHY83213.1 hypothetical protein [Escherichia phage e4/1c]